MLVSQMAPQHVRGPAPLVTLAGKVAEKRRNRFAAAEKGLLSHGVSREGAHQCRVRPARELYAHQRRQVCADLKTNKKIPVM